MIGWRCVQQTRQDALNLLQYYLFEFQGRTREEECYGTRPRFSLKTAVARFNFRRVFMAAALLTEMVVSGMIPVHRRTEATGLRRCGVGVSQNTSKFTFGPSRSNER